MPKGTFYEKKMQNCYIYCRVVKKKHLFATLLIPDLDVKTAKCTQSFETTLYIRTKQQRLFYLNQIQSLHAVLHFLYKLDFVCGF